MLEERRRMRGEAGEGVRGEGVRGEGVRREDRLSSTGSDGSVNDQSFTGGD